MTKCRICLVSYNGDIYTLKCGHIFHTHCILQWVEYKNDCPICRCNVPTEDGKDVNYLEDTFDDSIGDTAQTEISASNDRTSGETTSLIDSTIPVSRYSRYFGENRESGNTTLSQVISEYLLSNRNSTQNTEYFVLPSIPSPPIPILKISEENDTSEDVMTEIDETIDEDQITESKDDLIEDDYIGWHYYDFIDRTSDLMFPKNNEDLPEDPFVLYPDLRVCSCPHCSLNITESTARPLRIYFELPNQEHKRYFYYEDEKRIQYYHYIYDLTRYYFYKEDPSV
jgi:hypothetical protein